MDSFSMPKTDPVETSPNASSVSASRRPIDIVNNRIESRDLFVGTKEITIGHEGEAYRLRLTALNKLILTK
ncbi:MAG TPA: hemin uptake protein HemP [Xanthobacteraceae bacterium]|nr:hemin uptake protein HemP [Xanthobacteraceae bacterium]